MGQCSRPATEHELGTGSSTVQKGTRGVLLHKQVSLNSSAARHTHFMTRSAFMQRSPGRASSDVTIWSPLAAGCVPTSTLV